MRQFDGHSVAARAEVLPTRPLWDSGIRYKLLLDVNNAIINQTTREDLFHALAREIRKIVAYDRFSINIYDSASKLLRWFASAEGVSVKSMDDSPRSLEEGPVARAVIISRQPVIIPECQPTHIGKQSG